MGAQTGVRRGWEGMIYLSHLANCRGCEKKLLSCLRQRGREHELADSIVVLVREQPQRSSVDEAPLNSPVWKCCCSSDSFE